MPSDRVKGENTELFASVPVPKAILSLAVPTVISQLVFVIYNIADTFFIGQLGDPDQVAAATIALPFFIFGAAFSNLFGIGGSGVIARNLGIGNVERAKKCASFCLWTAVLLSLAYSIFMVFFHTGIFYAFGANEASFDYCERYVFWTIELGTPVAIFQLGVDFKASNTYSTMPWAINQNTEDPVAAMQVLNLLYTDPDLSTLLCWGQEGKEWQESGDGHIKFADGVDAQTSEYYNNVNWQMPNQFIARIWEGDSLDLWERMQNYNDNALASKAMGFTFDNSDVSGEYTALTNAYSEFQRQLELGFMNPDEGIPQLVERLKAAGLDDYIAAKQAQLNAWAEANGIQ